MNVALVGITGYSGMILYQMLSNHPHVKKINLYRKGLKEPELLK